MRCSYNTTQRLLFARWGLLAKSADERVSTSHHQHDRARRARSAGTATATDMNARDTLWPATRRFEARLCPLSLNRRGTRYPSRSTVTLESHCALVSSRSPATLPVERHNALQNERTLAPTPCAHRRTLSRVSWGAHQ
jgi:hypothetical protein